MSVLSVFLEFFRKNDFYTVVNKSEIQFLIVSLLLILYAAGEKLSSVR